MIAYDYGGGDTDVLYQVLMITYDYGGCAAKGLEGNKIQ